MDETEPFVYNTMVINDAGYIESWYVLCLLIYYPRDYKHQLFY
jgi:hypothetical protein